MKHGHDYSSPLFEGPAKRTSVDRLSRPSTVLVLPPPPPRSPRVEISRSNSAPLRFDTPCPCTLQTPLSSSLIGCSSSLIHRHRPPCGQHLPTHDGANCAWQSFLSHTEVGPRLQEGFSDSMPWRRDEMRHSEMVGALRGT
ncbi:hypothetical protein BHM03_00039845 [Ensete ventricosum]|nr:hypothetical protein BHM03_00039845 [Ensete ventricosum]